MRYLYKLIPWIFLLILTLVIFHSWFLPGVISGGDLWYYSTLTFSDYHLTPFAWSSLNDLGSNQVALLWVRLDFSFPVVLFGRIMHVNWKLLERTSFLFPYIIFSVVSSYLLFVKVFSKNRLYILSPILFLLNTYSLMIIGGGQVFFGLSYALSPLSLFLFCKLSGANGRKTLLVILTGLVFSFQILLDLRIAYIILIAVFIYWIILQFKNHDLNKLYNSFIATFIFPGIISILLNSFWILPTAILRQNPIQQLGLAYSSINALRFFSFAKLENTISLLHPNWPENIFGKVEFMRPEFLLIPILAFASLLFISKETKERKRYILFFAIIGLIGAFLAKGANDPFGSIYLWLFSHVPGFVMFRDPTKFYLLIALSYSILIPFTISQIYEWLRGKLKLRTKILRLVPGLFIVFFVLFWLFTIHQAVFGQLGGTLKTTAIPSDYVKLENFLISQKTFSRTFWIPADQRFGFYSNVHPKISAENFYDKTSTEKTLNSFKSLQTERMLQESAVKYVIVPFDSQDEIFLKEGKYDYGQYQSVVNYLKTVPWLREIGGFGKIKVFEVSNPKQHFWINGSGNIDFKMINPTLYQIYVSNVKKGEKLIFSESFDKKWSMGIGNEKIYSKQYGLFNSFVLDKNGNFKAKIYYEPQKYVDLGVVISTVSFVCVLLGLLFVTVKKRKVLKI